MLDKQMSSATFAFPKPIFRRIAGVVDVRRGYVIAGVCLLIAAFALRFYNLSEISLRFDEAKAALNSAGTLSDTLLYTRNENTSPILYPMALWALQKAASTDFSVRVMPAAGSGLTVAALLFLMPRAGAPRRAAFLAALLAALSAVAIEHAQDAREYSLDALVAALLIAGVLQYRRNGGKEALCGALFIAPLLQYGLIVFGVAVIGVAALAPGASAAAAQAGAGGSSWRRALAAVWVGVRGRVGLLLPIACFAGACALTWELTARYQWAADARLGYSFLADYYYQGGFDVAAIVGFAINRFWDLLIYHMPLWAALAGLLALAAMQRFRRFNGLALLCVCALGAALAAALTGAYPLGGIRQCLYLGPLIFLAVGWAFHAVVDDMAMAAGGWRRWVAPGLTAAVVGGIALVGASDIRGRDVYNASENCIKQIFAALDGRAQEGDAVYVSQWEVPLVSFYKREKPENYFYGAEVCWESSGRGCVREVFDEMFGAFGDAPRIWMIHTASVRTPSEMALHFPEVSVEEVIAHGWTTLHLITGHEGAAADVHRDLFAVYDAAISGEPTVAAEALGGDSAVGYDLHLREDALYYAKQPCGPADVDAPFFLHIYPGDVIYLTDYHRNAGFHNLDFDFHAHGALAGNRCVIRRGLPAYPIERIHTGQFVTDGGVVWEAEMAVER